MQFERAVSASLRSAQTQGPPDLVRPLRPKRLILLRSRGQILRYLRFERAVSASLRSAQTRGPQDLVRPLRPKRLILLKPRVRISTFK